MTTHARLVLEDCRAALADLVDGVQGSERRRRWVSAVVLLRVVGHVLENVDSKQSAAMAAAIKAEHARITGDKAGNPIFWEFIKKLRDQLVKEYDPGAGQGVTVHIGAGLTATGASFSYPVHVGAYAGRDQRAVLREAIDWWADYLDRIDKHSASPKGAV